MGDERKTSMCGYLLRAPLLGIWPSTQACAQDWESNLPALNPLSHTSQGEWFRKMEIIHRLRILGEMITVKT